MTIVKKQPEGYVGLSNLPNQYYTHFIKNGIDFTILIVGESGLGKSTLINTLFNHKIYTPRTDTLPTANTPKQSIEQVTLGFFN